MKLLVKVVIAAALALGAVYYLGGAKDWDPSQQGLDHRAAITSGILWNKVFDITGDPRHYTPLKKVEGEGYAGMEILVRTA